MWKKWNKLHNLNESVSTSRQCSTSLIDNSTTRLEELLREVGNDAAGHDEQIISPKELLTGTTLVQSRSDSGNTEVFKCF